MTRDDLDALMQLEGSASAAPWHVFQANDDMAMSATLVTKNPRVGRDASIHDWHSDDVVAACLLQSPPAATSDDGRWDENARLIAAVRNALPELIRLARVGLEHEPPELA